MEGGSFAGTASWAASIPPQSALGAESAQVEAWARPQGDCYGWTPTVLPYLCLLNFLCSFSSGCFKCFLCFRSWLCAKFYLSCTYPAWYLLRFCYLCITFFLQKTLTDHLLKYFFYRIFSPLSFWGINIFDYFILSHMSLMICFCFVFHRFYYLCFSLDTFIDLSLRFTILSLVLFGLPISLSNELLILSILFFSALFYPLWFY